MFFIMIFYLFYFLYLILSFLCGQTHYISGSIHPMNVISSNLCPLGLMDELTGIWVWRDTHVNSNGTYTYNPRMVILVWFYFNMAFNYFTFNFSMYIHLKCFQFVFVVHICSVLSAWPSSLKPSGWHWTPNWIKFDSKLFSSAEHSTTIWIKRN